MAVDGSKAHARAGWARRKDGIVLDRGSNLSAASIMPSTARSIARAERRSSARAPLSGPIAPIRVARESRPKANASTAARHILVSLLCPIGDTLLATPALAALRRAYPRAEITVLVSASNTGILDGNPDITRRILVPAPGDGPQLARFLAAVRALSQERQKYDLVINLSAAGTIVTRLAGLSAPRHHLRMPPFWWLIGGRSRSFSSRHTIDQYLHAIAPLLPHSVTEAERTPRLSLTIRDRSAARRVLREHGLSPSSLLVTVHVGGDGFGGRKRWSVERFAAVARHLIEECDAHVLLIGGKAEVPLAEEARALLPEGATVLAGKTPLMVTAALIEQSTLFIGNDSGPLHIAAAVGTPAVGIFGPSNWRQFEPVGRAGYRQRTVHSNLPCSPCFHFVGNDPWWYRNPCQSQACLHAIKPEHVIDAARALLCEIDGDENTDRIAD